MAQPHACRRVEKRAAWNHKREATRRMSGPSARMYFQHEVRQSVYTEAPSHHLRHFRVDHVLVVVHNHIGKGHHVAGEEIGAPPLLAPKRTQVCKGVYPGRQQCLRARALMAFKKLAQLDVRVRHLQQAHRELM
eukprot:1156855-Pelagomonas_calceolata.AAC.3